MNDIFGTHSPRQRGVMWRRRGAKRGWSMGTCSPCREKAPEREWKGPIPVEQVLQTLQQRTLSVRLLPLLCGSCCHGNSSVLVGKQSRQVQCRGKDVWSWAEQQRGRPPPGNAPVVVRCGWGGAKEKRQEIGEGGKGRAGRKGWKEKEEEGRAEEEEEGERRGREEERGE